MARRKVTVVREGTELVFSDGITTKRYDIDALPGDMQEQLKYHGAIQKLRDSFAGDIDNWHVHTDNVYDALSHNEWSRKPESKLTQLKKMVDAGVFTQKQIDALKKAGLLK